MVNKKLKIREKPLRVLGTILSVGLLLYLLWKQDWYELWRQVSAIDFWVWLVCFGLYFTGQVFNSLRWFSLLKSKQIPISFGTTLKIILSGAFASNFLPSTIGGDVFRILGSKPYTRSYALGFASVIIDRLLNVCAMVTVLPFSIITFWSIDFDLETGRTLISGVGFVSGAKQKIEKILKQIKESLMLWMDQPRSLIIAFGISWLSIFVMFVANTVLAVQLGMPVNLIQVMGVNALTYLLTLVPITFNGYGVREVLITTLYVALGATVEQASAFALITRFFLMLETVPGSLWLSQIMQTQKLIDIGQ